MKGIDIFCTSQAATAISLSMEQPSSSSSSTILLGSGRAIDRHNPIIRDAKRISKSLPPCNHPQSPINPKPHKNLSKKEKNHKMPLQENYTEIKKSDGNDKVMPNDEKKKKKKDGETIDKKDSGVSKTVDIVRKSWSCTRPSSFISPPGSTRYLLGDEKVVFNAVTDLDQELKVFPEKDSKTNKVELVKEKESFDGEKSPASITQDQPQVVVLRVSLHCRGCEKKMRKHISRMEGVTSFNIDFMAKKVTVTGNVTPLSVLSSISKVKNAQLWPPTLSSTLPPVDNSGLIKNEQKGGDAQVEVGNKEGAFVSVSLASNSLDK